MVELTEEEIKNGWTEKDLEKYRKEREAAASGKIYFHPDFRKPTKREFANNKYRPLRWR